MALNSGQAGALALAAVILCACATTPPHESLSEKAHSDIASTDVVAPVVQSEIYVFVPNSNVGAVSGGGLLGALIDVSINSVRTGKAEDAVKGLRDSLVGFDFDTALQGALNAQLSQVSWMHAGNARIVKDVSNDGIDRVLASSTASAVLLTTTDYHLSNDGDELYVGVSASLFPNTPELRALVTKPDSSGPKSKLANSIYHNNLAFSTRLANASDDRDRNMAMWSANGGAPARAALVRGANALAQLLAADIQGRVVPPPGAAPVQVEIGSATVVSSDANGRVLRRADGTLLIEAAPTPSP